MVSSPADLTNPFPVSDGSVERSSTSSPPRRPVGHTSEKVVQFSMEDMDTLAVGQMIAGHSLERLFNSDKVERSVVGSPADLTNPFPVSAVSLERSSSGPPRFEG
jgi:hypothetical protein